MIKVYVFVSGLVLYQLAPVPGGTSHAILPAGHFDYPGLAHVAKHSVEVRAGQAADLVTVATPFAAELGATCPETGCVALDRPAEIPWLNDLLAVDSIVPRIQPGCLAPGGEGGCRPRGQDQPGLNGVLAFTGDWSVEAHTDCGTGYPKAERDTAELNFVRAARSWELRWDDANQVLDAANSMLFTTTVARIEDLRVPHEALRAALDPAKMTNCSNLPGFAESGAKQCAVLLVRNGSDDHYMGGGDIHFSALYALLENPELDPTELWLPIAVGERACEKEEGAGCGGLIKCVGTVVTSAQP